MKIIKFITIGLFAMQTYGLTAQISFYKIKDGVKTALTSEEPVKIELNGEGKPIDNILFEIDLKKFREKYKFDLINIAVGRTGFNSGLIRHEFDSEMNKKKYANVTQFNIYAFDNSEYKNGDGSFAVVSNKVFFSQANIQYTYYFKIMGQYITGQETYYDENSRSVKSRDVYSAAELIISLDVEYEQSQDTRVEARYREIIEDDYRIRRQKELVLECSYDLRTTKKKIPFPLSMYVGSKSASDKYPNISKAIIEIVEYKFNEIKEEKDKAKALEIYDAWEVESKMFCIKETEENEEKLKKLEKELGTVNTVEQKLTLIHAFTKG